MNTHEKQQISMTKVWTTLKDHDLMELIEDEELLDEIKMAKQKKHEKELLQQHIEKFYHIWKNDKGIFLSYLPDETKPKKRRPVTATTQERLERKIIDFYLEMENAEKKEKETQLLSTLRKLYPVWLNYKGLETTATTYIRRIDTDWKAYYVNDPIIDKDIRKLTKVNLKEWALTQIREHQMTKTQYYNMTVIIRQTLDYAVDLEIIPVNPFRQFKVDVKLFQKVKKPEDSTQVFLNNERPAIEAEAWNEFHEKGCTTALAVPLAFQTGLRLGELVALKECDLSEDGKYLHVQRMLQRVERQRPDGTWYPAQWETVEHTKTSAGERSVYLTLTARKIIQTILDSNKEHGFYDSSFLFVHGGKRITPRAVDTRIRKYCDKIDIDCKSTHKIRKSYISALLDSGININEVRKQVGHEDEKTTLRNYCFNRKERIDNESDFEKALAV